MSSEKHSKTQHFSNRKKEGEKSATSSHIEDQTREKALLNGPSKASHLSNSTKQYSNRAVKGPQAQKDCPSETIAPKFCTAAPSN